MRLEKHTEPYTEREFHLILTSDEYGQMVDFMVKNGVGYGPGRGLCVKFREANDEMKRREKKKKEEKKEELDALIEWNRRCEGTIS